MLCWLPLTALTSEGPLLTVAKGEGHTLFTPCWHALVSTPDGQFCLFRSCVEHSGEEEGENAGRETMVLQNRSPNQPSRFLPECTWRRVLDGARLQFSHLCPVPRTFPYSVVRKTTLEQKLLVPTPKPTGTCSNVWRHCS